YASNRGHNSIAIFKINSENGQLSLITFQSVLGENPRNFSLSPKQDFLLVANQNTDNIVAFKRDSLSGKLQVVHQISAPTPVCILF
ncbi:MAG: lactonase family protein, partial [Polaribacter sp.]